MLALAAAVRAKMWQQSYVSNSKSFLFGPWGFEGYKRLNHDFIEQILMSTTEGESYDVSVHFTDSGEIKVVSAARETVVKNLIVDGDILTAEVGGVLCSGTCRLFKRTHDIGVSVWSSIGNCTLYSPIPDFTHREEDGTNSGRITAQMHGKVVKVSVSVGDVVQSGDVLLILEAMKTEHAIKAPINGVVSAITTEMGKTVYDGQDIIVITEQNSSSKQIEDL